MKQAKKQNNWRSLKASLIVTLLTAIALYLANSYLNSSSYTCRHFPDKCVCIQKTDKFIADNLNCFEYPEYYKFRLKTQAELQAEADVKSCQDNPRDDEKCKCINYQYTYHDTLTENIINCTINSKLFNKQDLTISIQECINNGICQCERIGIPHCLHSRPKTEQEKHPENYVKEIQEVQIESEHNELNETGYRLCSNECYTKYYYHEVEDNFTRCDGKCKINNLHWNYGKYEKKITYRLKNECEKGNPNWVESIEYSEDWEKETNLTSYYNCLKLNCNGMFENYEINKQMHEEGKDVHDEYLKCSKNCWKRERLHLKNQTICRKRINKPR